MLTRGAAEAFALALDEGTANEPVIGLLEAVAVELGPQTSPTEGFRDATRTRLLAVAAVRRPEPATVPASRSRRVTWARRATAACASLLVVAVAAGGLSLGSRHALPGDPLYGAKRATEAVQLSTTSGALNQGLKRLHLAETRLAEVRALAAGSGGEALGAVGNDVVLAGGSRADLIRSTLRAMDADTTTGSGQVEQAARAAGTTVPLAILNDWSGQQRARLRAVAPAVPPAAQDDISASLTLVDNLHTRTAALLSGH